MNFGLFGLTYTWNQTLCYSLGEGRGIGWPSGTIFSQSLNNFLSKWGPMGGFKHIFFPHYQRDCIPNGAHWVPKLQNFLSHHQFFFCYSKWGSMGAQGGNFPPFLNRKMHHPCIGQKKKKPKKKHTSFTLPIRS